MLHTIDTKFNKTDYSKYMSENWLKNLDKLLDSEYMTDLIEYVNCTYEESSFTYPKVKNKNIFNIFNKIDLYDVRIVFIGEEPPANVYSNNIGPGTMFKKEKNFQLDKIKKCLNNCYFENKNLEFNNTLEHWTKQGIFYLNASLISTYGLENKHFDVFKHFTRTIIKTISDISVDIIFVFTNKKLEEEYSKYVNETYHHILTTNDFHPNSQIFLQIDELIEMIGPEIPNNQPVKW